MATPITADTNNNNHNENNNIIDNNEDAASFESRGGAAPEDDTRLPPVPQPPPIVITDIDIVSRWDGNSYTKHPGNLLYRQRILELKPLYQCTPDQKERSKMNKSIVEEFRATGARFLIERRTGVIEELTESEARAKVRDACRMYSTKGKV
jgi:hypothetical protein